ncbi:DUF6474 family protein [Saccharopolyspora rhizosphaerae]|uniref:DUF6474 family protein n=1 Tax=Saccharopolyspora rhizosphaerae TaxID=2492662 RepID=UPI001F2A15E6|nr:DUF6474 family protein [Saccharopolyspora rhizosphaerae]
MRRLARRRGKITRGARRGCLKCAAKKAKARKRTRTDQGAQHHVEGPVRANPPVQAAADQVVTPVPVGKKAAKALRKADKQTAKAIAKGEHGTVTPGNTKRVVLIAKVLAPVLTPFALRAGSSLRARYDRARARKLGVPVEELGRFTGRGAALHARIAGDANALRDLREQASGDQRSSAETYAVQAEARLAQLTSAVRAAERMPSQRRKAAHRAVDQELSRIEGELLTRFGVPTG